MGFVLAGCQPKTAPTQEFAATDISSSPWGANFNLVDHNGQPRTIADFKGKAVVLFFGYTHCPDVCPTTMAKLASVMQKLGPDSKRVQVLLVTLDPKRDTPEILRQYVPAFHPSFLGLSGDEQQIDAVAKEFKVMRMLQEPDKSGYYMVDHAGGLYAFDPRGQLRLFINEQHSLDTIVKDLQTLLKT
jgi:protein SCO1/2